MLGLIFYHKNKLTFVPVDKIIEIHKTTSANCDERNMFKLYYGNSSHYDEAIISESELKVRYYCEYLHMIEDERK